MPYADAADVLARYPFDRVAELTGTSDLGPAGEAPEERSLRLQGLYLARTARLDTAAADASAEIDSYLGRQYTLPFASPPPVLKRLAVDMAVYRLMSLLPKESVEDARRRYEDAIRWLEMVAAGEIQLDGATNTQGGGNVAWFAPTRVFDAEGLKGFM